MPTSSSFEVMASHSREASQFGSRSRRHRAGKNISRSVRRSNFFQFSFTRKNRDSVAMRKFVAIFNWKLSLPHKRIVLMAIGATGDSFPLLSACGGIENETRCCRLHSYTSNRYSCAERERSCTTRDALYFVLSSSHCIRELLIYRAGNSHGSRFLFYLHHT